MRSMHIALLAVMVCAFGADVRAETNKSSASFKSGFSSQRPTSSPSKYVSKPSAPSPTKYTPSERYAAPSAPSRGTTTSFGTFERRSTTPSPAPASQTRQASTSFGSFGANRQSGTSTPIQLPQKSTSALSRSLDKSAAETAALNTLDARRAAAESRRTSGLSSAAKKNADAASVQSYGRDMHRSAKSETSPQYGNDGLRSKKKSTSQEYSGDVDRGAKTQSYSQYGGAQNQPYRTKERDPKAPAVVHQSDNGLSNVLTGVLIGRATATPPVRSQESVPAASQKMDAPAVGAQGPAYKGPSSSGTSLFAGLAGILMLLIVVTSGCLIYQLVKPKSKPIDKTGPNYSLEGN